MTLLDKQKSLNPDVWTTKDGRHIPICDMTDEHLIATINDLNDRGFVSAADFDFYFNCNLPDPDTDAYWCALREQEETLSSPVCLQFDALRAQAKLRDIK